MIPTIIIKNLFIERVYLPSLSGTFLSKRKNRSRELEREVEREVETETKNKRVVNDSWKTHDL